MRGKLIRRKNYFATDTVGPEQIKQLLESGERSKLLSEMPALLSKLSLDELLDLQRWLIVKLESQP